jgi:hypothetical protein
MPLGSALWAARARCAEVRAEREPGPRPPRRLPVLAAAGQRGCPGVAFIIMMMALTLAGGGGPGPLAPASPGQGPGATRHLKVSKYVQFILQNHN